MSFQNIELYSLGEGKQNFLSVMMTAYGAQEFSKAVSIHTIRGMKNALYRGAFHAMPYGYRKAGEGAQCSREINPDLAPIVARIYREFADGHSARQIAKGLNADGLPAPKGGTWENRKIRGRADREEGILCNPIYVGRVRLFRTTHRIHPETEARVITPTPERAREKIIPELRIIEDDLWSAV
ncbi:recombinase family protein [Thioclava sp. 15-R06ZXC-3]|uniref:Recombinase family protein n=1 Tax=Thioclava arctica TaxID=3238301 RepID=A0ABV3TMP6_9RHOB